MLNSIGLQNIGIAALIRDLAPSTPTWRVPVIASIIGSTVGRVRRVRRRASRAWRASPASSSTSAAPTPSAAAWSSARTPRPPPPSPAASCAPRTLPVIVKLTPNVADPRVDRPGHRRGRRRCPLRRQHPRRPWRWTLGRASPSSARPSPASPGRPSSLSTCVRSTRWPGASTCRSSAAAASPLPKTPSSYLWPAPQPSRSAPPRSPTLSRPIEVLEGIEHYCEANGIAKLSDLVGVAQKRSAAAAP